MSRPLLALLILVALCLMSAPLRAADSREYAEIPVPAAMIYAGQPVTAELLRMRRVPASYLARVRVVTEPASLEGKLARSTLVPGRPIPVNQVRDRNVIEASKPVRTLFRIGSLEIAGQAVPLSSASAGERIRARNVDTGQIVSGIALEDGSLLVSEQ